MFIATLITLVLLGVLLLFVGFLLLGVLRTVTLLSWRMDQLEATTPGRLNRTGLPPGERAPEFTLADVDGQLLTFAPPTGRTVLLVFVQSRCRPCHAIVPELNRLQHRRPDLEVLGVLHAEPDEARNWASETGPEFTVVLQEDWSLSKRYEVFATPFAFLIDGRGVILSKGVVTSPQHIGLLLSTARRPTSPEPAVPERAAVGVRFRDSQVRRAAAPATSRGFTLVELLVVLAVSGILLALLLPAVQQAREAARRTQCRNNLKQIALALHSYHDRHRSFPPQTVVDPSASTGWWSWITRVLPDLDQRPLYEQFDLGDDVWNNCRRYKPYTSVRLPVFHCPSDPYSDGIYESDGGCEGGEAYALTSYLGCRGSTRQLPGNGVFPNVNRVCRLVDIRDGTSHTLLLGERPADPQAFLGWWAAGIGDDGFGLGDYVLDVSEGLHPGNPHEGFDLLHYWSAHPGGAHFALCDGSVRFVSYSTDRQLLEALATRNGEEVITGF